MSSPASAPIEPRPTQPTARLAAQGAMLDELRLVLPALRPATAREDARRAIVADNLLHRASLASRTKLATKLCARYMPANAPCTARQFVRALQGCPVTEQSNLLAYVMLVWHDALVFQLGRAWLSPRLGAAALDYGTEDILKELDRLAQDAPEVAAWGPETRLRVAQHYLGLLRDCGFATGSARKTLRRPYIGPDVVLFAVRLILGGGEAAADVPGHALFTTLGLGLSDVLEALGELDRSGRLRFASQGGIVRLELQGSEGGCQTW